MLGARELWAAAERQAAAHGVEITPAVRGLLANVLQAVLGEWAWEHEELARLRDFRASCMIAVGNGTTVATVHAELADLERFYAARRAADRVVDS